MTSMDSSSACRSAVQVSLCVLAEAADHRDAQGHAYRHGPGTVSLAEDLASVPALHRSTKKCSFGQWVASLDPADQDAVWSAVRGDRAVRKVAEAISRTYTVSASTILNHRVGVCVSCRLPTI